MLRLIHNKSSRSKKYFTSETKEEINARERPQQHAAFFIPTTTRNFQAIAKYQLRKYSNKRKQKQEQAFFLFIDHFNPHQSVKSFTRGLSYYQAWAYFASLLKYTCSSTQIYHELFLTSISNI